MKIAKNGEKGMQKTGVDYHTCGDDIFPYFLPLNLESTDRFGGN
jgi:hypothetical protein